MKLFAKSSRVSQPNYGSGTITSSDERYTVIEFDHHGRKTFLTDMVVLSKSDEPAPAKAAKESRRRSPKTAAPKTTTAKTTPAKTAKASAKTSATDR